MPLFLQLHLHTLAADRAEFDQFLRMLLPRFATLVLLMKTETPDTITGFGTEGRKNSALTASHTCGVYRGKSKV